MSSEKSIKIKEEDIIAKSPEINISVNIVCFKFLDSYGFLDASLYTLSTPGVGTLFRKRAKIHLL